MNRREEITVFLRRRPLCGAAWLGLAVFLAVLAESALLTAFPPVDRVSGRYDGQGPAFTEMARVREKAVDENGTQLSQIAAWVGTNTDISADSLNAELAVDALWVDGPAKAIWDLKTIAGDLPDFGSERCAALSRDTAAKLFGSTDVLGETIECGGRKFSIVCVFELPSGAAAPAADPGRALVLLPASALPKGKDGKTATVKGLECAFLERFSGDKKEAFEGWLSGAGVGTPDQMEDLGKMRDLYAFFVGLPSVLMALTAALKLAVEALRRVHAGFEAFLSHRADRLSPPARAWSALGAGIAAATPVMALALGAVLIPNLRGRLPPALIPTRWSDLGFWPGLITEWMRNMAESSLRGTLRPDLVRLNLAASSVLTAVFALPALIFAGRAFRQGALASTRTVPQAALWTLPISLMLSPMAMLIARRLGLAPIAPPGMSWLPALYAASLSLNFRTLWDALRMAQPAWMHLRNKKEGLS